jgi:hypothetical protein
VDSLALGSCRWQGTHSLDIALAVELDDKVIDEETLLDSQAREGHVDISILLHFWTRVEIHLSPKPSPF